MSLCETLWWYLGNILDYVVEMLPCMCGALAVFLLPNEKDIYCVIEAAKRTPVLESAVQKPLANTIGRKAAD